MLLALLMSRHGKQRCRMQDSWYKDTKAIIQSTTTHSTLMLINTAQQTCSSARNIDYCTVRAQILEIVSCHFSYDSKLKFLKFVCIM